MNTPNKKTPPTARMIDTLYKAYEKQGRGLKIGPDLGGAFMALFNRHLINMKVTEVKGKTEYIYFVTNEGMAELKSAGKITGEFSYRQHHILFIQGAGNEGYKADRKLVASLKAALGEPYHLRYPRIHSDKALPDFGWLSQIGEEIANSADNVILVAHSLGASLLLKYLAENKINKHIRGIFLIATPFWPGREAWQQGLKLHKDFADKLPKKVPIFLYQARDDEEVKFENLAFYAQDLPHAIVREIASGGHQLNNDLSVVARDIKAL